MAKKNLSKQQVERAGIDLITKHKKHFEAWLRNNSTASGKRGS